MLHAFLAELKTLSAIIAKINEAMIEVNQHLSDGAYLDLLNMDFNYMGCAVVSENDFDENGVFYYTLDVMLPNMDTFKTTVLWKGFM